MRQGKQAQDWLIRIISAGCGLRIPGLGLIREGNIVPETVVGQMGSELVGLHMKCMLQARK